MARPKKTPLVDKKITPTVIKKKNSVVKPSKVGNFVFYGKFKVEKLVYPCNLCPFTFDNKPDLDKHNKIHEPKPYPCERCNISAFADEKQLKLHLNHCPIMKPFRLGRKQKTVFVNDNKINWVKEEEIKIKMEPEDSMIPVPIALHFSPVKITEPSPVPSLKMRFYCIHCTLSYAHKSSLNRHVRNKHINISK